LGLVGAIATKMLAASWVGDSKWVHGWAMTCRAEFAYLVAQVFYWKNLFSDELLSIVMWALFCATIAGPIGFHISMRSLLKKDSHATHRSHTNTSSASSGAGSSSKRGIGSDKDSYGSKESNVTEDSARDEDLVEEGFEAEVFPTVNRNTGAASVPGTVPDNPGAIIIEDEETQYYDDNATTVKGVVEAGSEIALAAKKGPRNWKRGPRHVEAANEASVVSVGQVDEVAGEERWAVPRWLQRGKKNDPDFVPFPALGLHKVRDVRQV
jgi:hypothetical protein